MATTWGQRTCAPPLSGGDGHAPAKRAHNPINARLLLDIQALGAGGIQRAGGLRELALRHGVSVRSLQSLILETGRLTPVGQDKINTELHGLANNPITARLLQELSALGPNGIQRAGGVGALALQHGVSVGGLQKLILETGRLTASGQDKIKSEVLQIRHQPITSQLLQELSDLGSDGIQRAGGLGALALQHGVSVNSLHLLMRETGHLTALGQNKINVEVLQLRHQPITGQLLMELSALGPVGIKRAGGVAALALQHGVSVNGLRLLIRESGGLTALGQNKINGKVFGVRRQPIRGELLQGLPALGPDGVQRTGGVAALATRHDFSINGLRQLGHEDGRQTARGQDDGEALAWPPDLHLPRLPITGRLLQWLTTLGPDGIRRAGGVAALARECSVSADSLRQYVHNDGSLTARGQAKVNREVRPLMGEDGSLTSAIDREVIPLPLQSITGRLLQELSALSREDIHSAGGVAALAKEHNVSVNSLRQLMREDGSLSALGRDKINREVLALSTQPITDRLLQHLSALGRDGILCAGGVAALARRHDISVNGLRKLMREDGSLTARGRAKIAREAFV
jgi:ABC-type Co2+ transport system permease subunit